jgi:hypothetical protein
MRVIIAGGRDYVAGSGDWEFLDKFHKHNTVTEVVSGGATGADTAGRIWGDSVGIPVRTFLPDWEKHGRAAGPIRNREMARYADVVILFPGGAGTESMRREAQEAGIAIVESRAEGEAGDARSG